MAKITVHQIAALKARAQPYKQNVDIGLQLRVAVTGLKAWIVQYSVDGRQREFRLARPFGPVTDEGHLCLADARNEAARIRGLARDGIDVQVQQREQQEAALKAEADQVTAQAVDNLTLEDMFLAWTTDGVRRKDGNAELERRFEKDVRPHIGTTPIRHLTENDLRSVLRRVVERGTNRYAVVLRNDLAQMFTWSRKRQPWRRLLVDGDPMDLIEIRKIVAPEYDLGAVGKRVLSAIEIKELADKFAQQQSEYDASPDRRTATQPLEQATQRAIWIMLSALTRVGETSMALWEHVDLERGQWFIPKENVKDAIADLTIYLSPFTLAQFTQLHVLTGHCRWCFPSQDELSHINVKTFTKQITDRQAMFKVDKDGTEKAPLKNRVHDNSLVLGEGKNGKWTSHDLRRTGATMMQALRVPLDVIDRCQNHVLGGSKVRRSYMHYDYAREMRSAWAKLGSRLEKILKESSF